jgi:hypothetical protein
MDSKRKFYKTTIQITILSEEPYSPDSIENIIEDITIGGCSGAWEIQQTDILNAKQMAVELKNQASDPEFFNINEKGEDIKI